jgi:tetratricopeptide (TPR) repeat protein
MIRFMTFARALLSLAVAGSLATAVAAPSQAADKAAAAVSEDSLRPAIAALVGSAQDKLRGLDFDGAVADLDSALAQDPTAFELGVALAVRGGVLFTVGDIDGAAADWSRALEDGDLDAATQLHLAHNLEQIEQARLQ